LVIGSLQLVDLLMAKVPAEYKPAFRREGVFHEIEALASRDVTSSKAKDKDKESSDAPTPESAGTPVIPLLSASGAVIPGFKKLSSLSLEPEDAITLRSRVIRFKYFTDPEQFEPDSTFQTLQQLVGRLSIPEASENELFDVLKALAGLFDSPYTSVSSFELIQSGLVDGLLHFAVDPRHSGKKQALSGTFI
jgi:E3 ubiquitin-protein ligase TRIP12